MKILIIPVKETVHEDFKKIHNGLHAIGECEYVNFLDQNVSWAEVDEANPYVEVQFPAKKVAE